MYVFLTDISRCQCERHACETKRACVYMPYTYEARPRRTIRIRERLAKLASAVLCPGIDNAELVLMHSRINAPFMDRTRS